jgi:scyllo-inositol 2-dehydrogenase (NADP+)
MKKEIGVGLIGFGMAGQIFHAPIISCVKGLNLKVIQTSNAENMAIARQKYPDAEIVSDTSAILNRQDIDLIVVATPNQTHFEIAKLALQANKNVAVDKPFTTKFSEADELIELAQTQNKILTVFQNRRWDSDFLTVQKVLKSNLLGRLVETEIHYDRFRNILRENTWKEENLDGTGILYDLGSHIIDQAQMLFGLPQAITADIRKQRANSQIVDNFELILHYPNLKVTLKGGWLVREPLPRYILLGEQGSFIKYGLDGQEDDLKIGKTPLNTINWGAEPREIWGKINTEFNGVHFIGEVESEAGDYRVFYKNVRDVIWGNAGLAVTATQAANTIKIIELAMQSHEERRTVDFISNAFQ